MTKPPQYDPHHDEERAGELHSPDGRWLWVCPVSGCGTTVGGDTDGPESGDGRCPVHRERTLHLRAV